MKRLLIISPYFPPVNAADMHRVRVSLPYFQPLGWEAEVICIDEKFADMAKDPLLCESIPACVPVHRVDALQQKYTAKAGLGSIALRSLWHINRQAMLLLSTKKFDLVYFSTTQFPVCVLGARWKRRFGVPYVIDMQDPWHSDYYQNKPKNERPPKYWFSYRLNKWLEPRAMKQVSGLISVSQAYIDTLRQRYPVLKGIPAETIPFSASEQDFEIAEKRSAGFPALLNADKINLVYCGRGGHDMYRALRLIFSALKKGLQKEHGLFNRLHLYFIGTSYATGNRAQKTIMPLAEETGVSNYVSEIAGRVGFYHALALLKQADALLIPGSDDAQYTASKIYPFILSKKPILAVFHPQSSAAHILRISTNATVVTIDSSAEVSIEQIYTYLKKVAGQKIHPLLLNEEQFAPYTALSMAKKQVCLFNRIV